MTLRKPEFGFEAIENLLDRGVLTPDQSIPYEKLVQKGVSFKDYVLSHVGTALGTLYLKEERVEHLVLYAVDLDLSTLSVPEMVLLQDDLTLQPWHQEKFSGSSIEMQFRMEASEPWHISLREKWKKVGEVSAWFASHPHYQVESEKVVATAYPC